MLSKESAQSQPAGIVCTLSVLCLLHQTHTRYADEPLTQQALDKRCEMWLDRMFGQRLDFAIENSLPVCLEDGIIKRDSEV